MCMRQTMHATVCVCTHAIVCMRQSQGMEMFERMDQADDRECENDQSTLGFCMRIAELIWT